METQRLKLKEHHHNLGQVSRALVPQALTLIRKCKISSYHLCQSGTAAVTAATSLAAAAALCTKASLDEKLSS